MPDTTCSNCGALNADSQRFCGECGTALAAVCSNSHSNPPGQKFCGYCGEDLGGNAEAKVAAREAYDWFSDKGAHGYLDLYSHVWEQQLNERAAAG